MLKILVPLSLIGLLALAPIAQARATHATPDHYTCIPPRTDISCKQARALLKNEGYRVSKTIRCGGNYYMFKAQRSGRNMIIRVMTARGKQMINARSGSKGQRWRMASS
jgi:hypothetical protein